MKMLKVPYAQKDQAKALGARWNAARKSWYVPDGQDTAPFEQWMTAAQPGDGAAKPAAGRIDARAGEPVTGALYLVLEHDCNPFVECTVCKPLLDSSGWNAAHLASKAMLRAV